MTIGVISNFNDGKDPGALRTIGEVSKALAIAAHVLRYWEQKFPMLQPLKRSGGRRYYRAADIALVQSIDRLVNREGYTLRGARKALEQSGIGPAEPALGSQADSSLAHPSQAPASPETSVRAMVSPASSSSALGAGASLNREILPRLQAIRLRLAAALEG